MNEQQLLLDCVLRLNRTGIGYMLTGSMASNAWGIPRTTHDLDFVIQLRPSKISVLVSAFAGDDYYIDEQSIRAAYEPPYQFNVIHIPSALKVDFWVLKGTGFEREMFDRRFRETWFEQTVYVATPEDVILHKLYWHKITPSDRQIADAIGVVQVQGEKLDATYMKQWATQLGVSSDLEAVLAGKPKHT